MSSKAQSLATSKSDAHDLAQKSMSVMQLGHFEFQRIERHQKHEPLEPSHSKAHVLAAKAMSVIDSIFERLQILEPKFIPCGEFDPGT